MADQLVAILIADLVAILVLVGTGLLGYGKLNQRVANLEEERGVKNLSERFRELHTDHVALDSKVDSIARDLNRVIGILSMAHPDAARSFDD